MNQLYSLTPRKEEFMHEVLVTPRQWAEYKLDPRKKPKKSSKAIQLTRDGRYLVANSHYRERLAKLLVIIPAHNEEDTIEDTINQILIQTRKPDRIVVSADNCTDNTVKIVRRIARKNPIVKLHITNNNTQRKVGALNQAWLLYSPGYDIVACIDADTVIWQGVLEDLEEELLPRTRCAGIMAKYTFDEEYVPAHLRKSKEPVRGGIAEYKEVTKLPWKTRQLVRAQRLEFTSHTLDLLRRGRKTYVLGGQATMFRQAALVYAAARNNGYGPWNSDTDVEDMELTWRFQDLKLETLISPTARADAGAMYTLKALWAQRRKWDEGMIRLLLRYGISRQTFYPITQQLKMSLDLLVRVMFVLMLTASIVLHSFVWSWVWLLPPLLAILINLKVASKAPRAKLGDYIFALLYFPAEIYLWFRLASFASSWTAALMKPQSVNKDNWAIQARAEKGQTNGAEAGVIILGSFLVLVLGMVISLSLMPRDLADSVVAVGWQVMSYLTIGLTAIMGFKLLSMILRDSRYSA
jgi:poly-beta-1,6-N-acetyl-D-glucosamine synthase